MWILEVALHYNLALSFWIWLTVRVDIVAIGASFGPPTLPMEDRPGWVLAGPVPAGGIPVLPAVQGPAADQAPQGSRE